MGSTVSSEVAAKSVCSKLCVSPLTEAGFWLAGFVTLTGLVAARWLEPVDTALLLVINKSLACEQLDPWMAHLSALGNRPIFWLVLSVWLGWRTVQRWGRTRTAAKQWLSSLVVIALAIGIADGISGRIVKPLLGRERPPQVVKTLRLLPNFAGGKAKAYPSSHAANAFAAARVLHELAPPKALWWVLAALIAYSRIYLGVHFPTDVVGGALLGLTVGAVLVALLRRIRCSLVANQEKRKGVKQDGAVEASL